jgi:DNA-binding MarR family transcriptional regulator
VTADEAGLRAWRAMLLAYNTTMRAIDSELDRTGSIPLTWYDVLLELHGAPNKRLRMQELSARVVLSRTRVSRLVDDMARAGLVRKVPDEVDRRSIWAVITDMGGRELRKTAPRYLRCIEAFFSSHLSKQEKKMLATALHKVHTAHAEKLDQPIRRNPAPRGDRVST